MAVASAVCIATTHLTIGDAAYLLSPALQQLLSVPPPRCSQTVRDDKKLARSCLQLYSSSPTINNGDDQNGVTNRKQWLQSLLSTHSRRSATSTMLLLLISTATPLASVPIIANAAATTASPPISTTLPQVRSEIALATDTLQILLKNWERAVVDCTYADVPRELLQQENKELLLEKASTFALFDKSVSVTSCKTVVSTVREYLGHTGVGPVAGLETSLKRALRLALEIDRMDTETMDQLVQTVEDVQRELTRADSLSYSARRDFSSMNNFDPEETANVLQQEGNLALCKAAIQAAVDRLQQLLKLLPT